MDLNIKLISFATQIRSKLTSTAIFVTACFFLSEPLFWKLVFKKTCSFTTQIRQRISDFGVLLAILIMVGVDIAVGINTPKLIVPEQFKVGQLLSAKTRFSQTSRNFLTREYYLIRVKGSFF